MPRAEWQLLRLVSYAQHMWGGVSVAAAAWICWLLRARNTEVRLNLPYTIALVATVALVMFTGYRLASCHKASIIYRAYAAATAHTAGPAGVCQHFSQFTKWRTRHILWLPHSADLLATLRRLPWRVQTQSQAAPRQLSKGSCAEAKMAPSSRWATRSAANFFIVSRYRQLTTILCQRNTSPLSHQ